MALTQGQRTCVETLDRPLVVAAGAGSGKTFTLTQRIVGALETGFISDIDEVCAITFTKKAAAELKSRIKAELRARNLIDQALRVDEAWVSTIHGMCARILRAHAIELGIDPSFKVAEGADATAYLDRAVNEVLTQVQFENSPQLDALFAEYPARGSGWNSVSVEKMLSSIVDAAASLGGGDDVLVLPGCTVAPAMAVQQAVDAVQVVFDLAAAEKEGAKRDEWIARTAELLQAASDSLARGISDYATALRVIAPFKLAKTFGTKEFKAHVDDARVTLGTCVMEARLGAARAHLETLAMLAHRVLAEFAALKRADGVLDNTDLLVMASRAIQGNPSIAACYADKFKLVMVDEFQDTDQMQVDMIKRLAGEGASRLCTVGDAQQSIYRFRGADVSVYRRHLESVRSAWPESVIQLSANFRSHPDVLAFVDCVFGKPSMFGGEFMSLAPGRDETRVKAPFSDSDPRVIVQHTVRPRQGVVVNDVTRVAANRIADEFARLAKEGHAPGEMVVLLGGMPKAAIYAQALRDRGLPCVVAGGSVFASSMEARIMSELVRAIANPLETQSLFNVLTSPLFALTGADLLRVGGVAGFWRAAYEMQDSGEPGRLACALRVMAGMRASIGRLPVADLMERVAVDSGWLSRLQAQGPEGLAAAGNAFKAIRMVRAIESGGALGPASVARRFAETLEGSKEAPGALSVSGGDSVRIMTIHASKGLEFPIVAVAEVKEKRSTTERLVVASIGGKAYLSLDLYRTLDEVGNAVDAAATKQIGEYVLGLQADEDELAQAVAEDAGVLHRRLALCEHAAMGDEEEAKRLLYVAITRAKECVVISSIGTRSKDNPLGIPRSSLAGVFEALDPTGAIIGEGRSSCAFGGSHPAVVECLAINPEDGFGDAEGQVDQEAPLFAVPIATSRTEADWQTYKAVREGVFSYSSISDASHEGDVLDRLAQMFALSVDEAAPDDAFAQDVGMARVTVPAVMDDDGYWDFDVSQAFDEDRATDLGTAFHRLAQYAVLARGERGPIQMPPAERIEALARTCNLDAVQRQRLSVALDRWIGSEVANEMEGLSDLAPEVPFFIALPETVGHAPAYLEGEIDLLGFGEGRTRAVVVDYKTGGHADEALDDLRRKHVLQAACYAYAILMQGVQRVDAVFVRVERGRADDDSNPQCVRYRFEASDIPALAQVIAEVHDK